MCFWGNEKKGESKKEATLNEQQKEKKFKGKWNVFGGSNITSGNVGLACLLFICSLRFLFFVSRHFLV